jgi:RNA polymerase sigma-70 factor (ECF subfamily)
LARHLGAIWSARHAPIEGLAAEDLYLAGAAAAGSAAAAAALDPLFAAACDGQPAPAEELRQELRHKLLTSEGGAPPRIAGYSGEGPLRAWLRVSALRTALTLRKRTSREEELDEEQLMQLRSPSPDPELDYLRARHGNDFRLAFADALESLPARDRAALRLHHVEGVGVEELGRLHGVHASTVSRRLAASREALLQETRRLLGERLKLTASEVESLIGALGSDLRVSLRRLLPPE